MRESIPLAFVVIIATLVSNPKISTDQAYRGPFLAFLASFTFFRIMFVCLYIKLIQPWRSACFALGQLMIAGMGLLGIIAATQDPI